MQENVSIGFSRLIALRPFYSVLLTDLLRIEETESFPGTGGTDGKVIYINPTNIVDWSPKEVTRLFMHEVLHIVLGHIEAMARHSALGTGPDGSPWDANRANIAMDIIVNGIMLASGERFERDDWLVDLHVDAVNTIWEEVYCTTQKTQKSDTEPHTMWGTTSQHTPEKLRHALQAAAMAAEAMGSLPAGLARIVEKLCGPQINWRDALEQEIYIRAGRDSSTWAKPNRRRIPFGIYYPGVSGVSAGVIAVYGDSSGSICEEWSQFLPEMASIIDSINPEQCYIGSVDSQATEPLLVSTSDEVLMYAPVGGGGTYMPAVFTKLEEHGIYPDVCVILTDGYTGWGSPPPYPVIWVCTTNEVAPYGKTIKLEKNFS